MSTVQWPDHWPGPARGRDRLTGSERIDRIMKLADYADAGIPTYWIVGLDDEVTLDAFALVDGRYEPTVQGRTGRVRLDEPVAVGLDLDALVASRMVASA